MNLITSTSIFPNSVRMDQRYQRCVGLSLILMLCCAAQAEALVDTNLIVGALKGQAPVVALANEKAGDVISDVLPQLIGNDDQFAVRLGFTDSNDVAPGAHAVTFTHPYPVFVVDLRLLHKLPAPLTPVDPLKAGIDFIALETNWSSPTTRPLPVRYLYPIQVDGVVVSSVLLARDETNSSQWNILQIGSSQLVKKTYEIESPGVHFLVHIPALNQYYLGLIQQLSSSDPVTFTIRAIFDDPDLPMKEGQTRLAHSVFNSLKSKAGKINTTDPNYPPR